MLLKVPDVTSPEKLPHGHSNRHRLAHGTRKEGTQRTTNVRKAAPPRLCRLIIGDSGVGKSSILLRF